MEPVTIIYYSANTENESFENKIINNLKKQANNIPIISITHKPIDLGNNICIGIQPVCYSNSWKQLLLGLKEANTEFCLAAESDCLYPPEYFNFIPQVKDVVFRYANVWVYWKRKPTFYRKPRCEGAQMCGREYWIERLETVLEEHKGWQPIDTLPTTLVTRIFPKENRRTWTGNPVITFKTGQGLSQKTSLIKGKTNSLPYWGTVKDIKERMFT